MVIPVDLDEPMYIAQVPAESAARTAAYNRWVGGYLEVVMLDDPTTSLYCNEEGKNLAMPVNPRATALAWMHNEAFALRDVVNGPAFIVGDVDQDGEDLTAPSEMVSLLMADGLLEGQISLGGQEGPWRAAVTIDTWEAACAWVTHQIVAGACVRLVPCTTFGELEEWVVQVTRHLSRRADLGRARVLVDMMTCRDVQDAVRQMRRSRAGGVRAGRGFLVRDLLVLNQGLNGEDWVAMRAGRTMALPGLAAMADAGISTLLRHLLVTPPEAWSPPAV